jgi:hypothetical protein
MTNKLPATALVTRPARASSGSSLSAARGPSLIVRAREAAQERFLEFFAATIRNKNTREAYFRAVLRFFKWTDARSLELDSIRPIHVAAYIEALPLGSQIPP